MSGGPSPAVDRVLRPHWEALGERLGPLELLDAHTHIGSNDPDGFSQTPEGLLAGLDAVGARAITFPMHEPEGYRAANDAAIELARSSGGRVEAFARVNPTIPSEDALAEAERALEAGARGIKLHPRAESFTLAEPALGPLFALASERRIPVLVHAGRGIPSLGADAVRLAAEHPGARLILAHCGISDLAWIWREVEAGSNLYFDTSWWNPADLIALLTLVPASQVLWASDSPYTSPLEMALCHLRCALQAGLGHEAIRSLAGGQAARLLAGEQPLRLGAATGERGPLDPLLERAYTHLVSAFGCSVGGGEPSEQLDLARLACRAPGSHPHAELLAAVEELCARIAADHLPAERSEHRYGDLERLIVAAMTLTRTPAAGPARPA